MDDIILYIYSFLNIKCHTCHLKLNLQHNYLYKYNKYFCSKECFNYI